MCYPNSLLPLIHSSRPLTIWDRSVIRAYGGDECYGAASPPMMLHIEFTSVLGQGFCVCDDLIITASEEPWRHSPSLFKQGMRGPFTRTPRRLGNRLATVPQRNVLGDKSRHRILKLDARYGRATRMGPALPYD